MGVATISRSRQSRSIFPRDKLEKLKKEIYNRKEEISPRRIHFPIIFKRFANIIIIIIISYSPAIVLSLSRKILHAFSRHRINRIDHLFGHGWIRR